MLSDSQPTMNKYPDVPMATAVPVNAGQNIPSAIPVATAAPVQQTFSRTNTSATATGTVFILPRGDQVYYEHAPKRVVCQFCGYDVVTRTVPESGAGTHLIALGLCFIGCIPCCLCPYCIDSLKDTVHICPNCNHTIGTKRML